ncbi:MAG: hypothetical protein CL910_16505 [Deltaproteobacteria bacterium]|nr:hypothetical protein [Deltaproteobacteria bacterium]
MRITMIRSMCGLGACCVLMVLAGCSSSSNGPDPMPPGNQPPMAGPGRAEPDLPTPEASRLRNLRLIRVEQAVDNWYVATQKQEYGRKESLELLLLQYTRENFDEMVSDLKHGSTRFRRIMAAALGFSSDVRAIGPLMEALQDSNYEVVEHSLLSLYHLVRPDSERHPKEGSKEGRWQNKDGLLERAALNPDLLDVEKIASYLQHHRPGVRCNAALALRPLIGKDRTPNSVLLALINATEDRDDATRVHAIAALGATRSSEAIPHLVKALSDTKGLCRIRAALGLARIGDTQATSYMIEVLEREKETKEVKRFVGRSLAALLGVADERALSIDGATWRDIAKDLKISVGN